MGESTKLHADRIDLDILPDPYRHHIVKGQDKVFLHALCDALDVSVSILDEDLNYQFIGDAVFKSLDIKAGDLSVGDNLSQCHELMVRNGLLTPEILSQNALTTEEQKERAEQGAKIISKKVRLGDGSVQIFKRKTLPNGLTVSMANDVSEIVEKDDIIEKALALGNAGYWTYEFATKSYYLNQSLRNYFSKADQEKIATRGIISIVHPEDRHLLLSALESVSATNDTFTTTCRTTTLNGNVRWSMTNGKVIRDNKGKAIRLRAFVKDITRERRQSQELERAKDEAIAASHAKSEFLANMSHEIRTPMNGILGMAELLSCSNIDDRQREFVNVINNSASALLTIINDILDFSKIEAGAFEMDPVPFDLKSSVNDVASMLSASAQDKNLELIINYPVNAKSKFIGDGGRLRQVITNLLGNAIKFTEEGFIVIDVKISDPRDNIAFVTLSVTDTGIGIDEEKLRHIFNKFTQADNSTTRVYGGTGLGLSISKAIVELMDGRITAQSELGHGSTFTAHIPLEIDGNAIEQSYDTAILRHKRALIVDDIQVNRSLLTEQLTNWDMESDSVKDGIEALTKLKMAHANGRPYDLILTDFLMPGMDGHDLSARITSTPEIAGTPIIMLSSCDQSVRREELKKIGINNYLTKPAREAQLHKTILATLTAIGSTRERKAPQACPQTQAHTSPRAEKIEILVAEDFNLNQDVIRLMVADTHYEPIFVETGLEAVQIYKADPDRFPLILMDVSMPVMNGHEATRLIQAHEAAHDLKPVPIIALTGHALKGDREKCMEAGMCDYLTKPVKQSELLGKIALWLETSDAVKAIA